MKNREAIRLYQFLAGPVGANLKMKYKTRLVHKKNLKALGEFYQNIAEMEADKNLKTPIIEEFEKDILERGAHLFERNSEGEIIYTNGDPNVLPGLLPEALALRSEMAQSEKYKETIDKREAVEQEWKDLLEDDIDFEIIKTSIEGFEESDLTSFEWSVFELILEEEE